MDYMELITHSCKNAWRYKFLWLFGFLAALGDSGAGAHLWSDVLKREDDGFSLGALDIEPAILVLVGIVLFGLWILTWVLSVLGEGSLIHGISRKELNLPVDFGQCWSIGLEYFFRLFGIMLLTLLAGLFSLFAVAQIIVPAIILSGWAGVALFVLILPFLIVAIFVVVCVEAWAIRYALLYDIRWLQAIAEGWRLFKDNVGKTIGVAFSSFITQLVIGVGTFVGMAILAVPFVLIGLAAPLAGLIPGIAVGLAILILLEAFCGTFASSVWTLGFLKLTAYSSSQKIQSAP